MSGTSPKPFSSRCHVLVECPFRLLPSCRFIAFLFCVTTLSVIDLIGKEQIKPLCFCSLEWNVWLHGQSDSTHRDPILYSSGHAWESNDRVHSRPQRAVHLELNALVRSQVVLTAEGDLSLEDNKFESLKTGKWAMVSPKDSILAKIHQQKRILRLRFVSGRWLDVETIRKI